MLAKFEKRAYSGSEKVWVGKYRNLRNISHWHMEHELIACKDGSAQVMLDDCIYPIFKGQCIFCRSSSVHYIDAEENSTLLVCLFNEKINSSFAIGLALQNPVFDDCFNILDTLSEIRRELKEKRIFFEEKTEAMISKMLVDIFRNLPLTNTPAAKPEISRYKQLLNKIDSEYEFITFSEAANFMNLSESYFSKYFKKQAGITFSQYLNVVKVEKAIEILNAEHDVKISDVMLRCGFDTIRSFNRQFRNITGYTPKTIPAGYVLNTRSVPAVQDTFDPTMENTVLLKE